MFYDPLGLISPITLPIKLILQNLFELKFEWDTNIDATLGTYGNNILKDLNMSALSLSNVTCSAANVILFSSMAFVIVLRRRIVQLCIFGFHVKWGESNFVVGEE